MSNKCKRKELPITYVQYNGENIQEVIDFAEATSFTPTGNVLVFSTKHSSFTIKKGDYLLKEGDAFWMNHEDYFNSLYEKEGE